MIGDYRVYDADAHVILAPAMWEDLPEKYVPRRPRPATFSDSSDMATYTSGWRRLRTGRETSKRFWAAFVCPRWSD